MELNTTPIDITRSGILTSSESLQHGFIERLLLALVASLGLLGSVFIISNSAGGSQPSLPDGQGFSYSAIAGSSLAMTEGSTKDLDDYLTMDGNMRVDDPFFFQFLRSELPKDHRYMLDMGDGMRILLTVNRFDYTYSKEGTYTIDLIGVKNAVVTKIASKNIRIER